MGHEPLRTVLQHLRRVTGTADPAGVSDGQLVERFVRCRDEAAFELLVRRHERLVLNVCRRVLRDSHDADDAFQATFLVLVRKAGSIGKRASVAGWLYRVAYRVALRARAGAARRTAHEKRPADLATLPDRDDRTPDAAWRELRPLLDQEVSRLPEKYRVPVVLCYLESRTYEEAARALGCSRGTVSTRLTRARELLRRRLIRRGVTLSAALLATLLIERAAAAAPAGLADAAVRAAHLLAAGQPTAGLVSANVVSLTEGALQAMASTKRMVLTGVVLALAVTGAGTGTLTYRSLATAPEDQAPARAASQAAGTAPEAQQNLFDGTEGATQSPRKVAAEAPAEFGWRERAFLTDDAGNVLSVAFSPDGKLLATASGDGVAGLWDVASGKLVRKIEAEHGGELYSAVFSPEGAVLATGGGERPRGGSVKLWDVRTGRGASAVQTQGDVIGSVAFAPDGRLLAAGSRDGTVRLWKVTGNREPQGMTLQGPGLPVLAVAFSPDGQRLAAAEGEEGTRAGAAPGEVKLWDAASGRQLAVIHGHAGTVAAVAFSPDGKTLASAGADRTVRLWDPATGQEVRRLGDAGGPVRRVAFSPDGRLLASTGKDGEVIVWDVATGKQVATLRGRAGGRAHAVAFSPDGRLLAVGGATGRQGYVILWERVPPSSAARGGQADVPPLPQAGRGTAGDRLDQLLQDMLRHQRSDEQIVDGLFLATLGRYPTDTERKLVLDGVNRRPDRAQAFGDALYLLTSSPEFRTHVEALEKRLPASRK